MPPCDFEKIFSNGSDDSFALVVGPNYFQNILFADYIENHSLWKSAVVDTISPIVANSGKIYPKQTAVLYDCFGLNGSVLDSSVLADIEQMPHEWLLVLFNLDRNACIEKKALGYGVNGFFYHNDSIETLRKGLTAIFGGEFWVSRSKMADIILENGFRLRYKQITDHAFHHELTRREVEVLGLLSLGAANEAIANKLFISPHTVRTHLNHIFRKIKVNSRLEASIWAADTLFRHKPE